VKKTVNYGSGPEKRNSEAEITTKLGRLDVGPRLVHMAEVHGNGPREVFPYLSRGGGRPCGKMDSINGITPCGKNWGTECCMIKGNPVCDGLSNRTQRHHWGW
jgi:hypothetical protein